MPVPTLDQLRKMPMADIKKDAKLGGALMRYMKGKHCEENFLFYFAKGDPMALYDRFIKSGAPMEVNLDSKLTKAAAQIASAGDAKMMQKVIDQGKKKADAMIRSDTMPGFLKSKEFKEYAEPIMRADAEKSVQSNVNKACKVLGISDKKLLSDAMVEMKLGNKKTAEKLLADLAKKEKIKDKAKDMIKTLEKAGVC